MTFAVVASTKLSDTGTTPAVDTTGASLLVAYSASGAADAVITDSKSNTWTRLTERTSAFSGQEAIFYIENPTVGTNHTFTSGGLGNVDPGLVVVAFSGAAISGVFDQESSINGTTSPAQPGSVTPSEDNELIVTCCGGTISGFGAPSGYTLQESLDVSSGANYGVAIAYKIQTSASAENPSWTFTDIGSGNDGSVAAATFKSTGGGGSVGGPILQGRVLSPGRIFGGSILG